MKCRQIVPAAFPLADQELALSNRTENKRGQEQNEALPCKRPQTGLARAERVYSAWQALDDVEQRVFADFAFRQIAAGEPLPVFISSMSDARDWAAWAMPMELDAYALASFEAMTPSRQAAFLAHVQRRAAA
jgi:hypothetical protein